MRGVASVSLVSAALLLCAGGGQGARTAPLYIHADRLFTGKTLLSGGAVVAIDRGKIVAAGRLRIPTGARVMRFRNATILPGLIDLHVHETSRAMLKEGVTTTRNLGQPIAVLRPTFAAPGFPRVVAAGPIITVPGGYPTRRSPAYAAPVSSTADAIALVDSLVAKGAGVIKISVETGRDGSLPTLSVDQVAAIVSEAHRLHRIVTAHVLEGQGLDIALAGGVDEIAHMPCLNVSAAQITALVQRRIPVTGTLHIERLSGQCPDGLANAREFVRQGGTLLYGTDVPAVPPGLDFVELALMQQAGMTPTRVLKAATSGAGKQLGIAKLGVLTSGAPADLWVVRGNPTRQLAALEHPLLVIARGKRVP